MWSSYIKNVLNNMRTLTWISQGIPEDSFVVKDNVKDNEWVTEAFIWDTDSALSLG